MVWFYHLLATLLPGVTAPKSGYESDPRDPSMLSQITTDDGGNWHGVWLAGTGYYPDEALHA